MEGQELYTAANLAAKDPPICSAVPAGLAGLLMTLNWVFCSAWPARSRHAGQLGQALISCLGGRHRDTLGPTRAALGGPR
jgi:hypothetical protein